MLLAGTSGFGYPSWRGGFYPPDARPDEFLRRYSERLNAVELNVTSYRLPSEEQLHRWADETPAGFRFAVRLSRRVTDRGDVRPLGAFCARIRSLGDKLGPLLVRLPPERPRDDGFLRLLLGSLDPELNVAIDLPHPSWAAPEVARSLADAAAVPAGSLDPSLPFWYQRLREPPYPEPWLASLAADLRPLAGSGRDVWAFFRHEDDPRGALAAVRLRELARRDR